MGLLSSFWNDQSGAIVSAELIAVSTVGVLGSTVGLNMLATSVNGEFKEMSHAVRSLNQSYSVAGHQSCRAWSAGSFYVQPDVKKSIAELDAAFVGDQAPPPKEPKSDGQQKKRKGKKGEKGDKNREKNSDQDEAAFAVPDESSLGEPDPVAPEDDASRVETTVAPALEV